MVCGAQDRIITAILVNFNVPKKEFLASLASAPRWVLSEAEYYHLVQGKDDPLMRNSTMHVPNYLAAAHAELHVIGRPGFVAWKSAVSTLEAVPESLTGFKRPNLAQGLSTPTLRNVLLTQAMLRSTRRKRYERLCRHKSVLHRILCNIAPARDAIIIVGDAYDGTAHAHTHTRRSPLLKILRFLASKRRVLFISEFRTTRACSNCSDLPFKVRYARRIAPDLLLPQQVSFMQSKNGRRVDAAVICSLCKKTLPRDVNACRNMAVLAWSTIWESRPPLSLTWREHEAITSFARTDPFAAMLKRPAPVKPGGDGRQQPVRSVRVVVADTEAKAALPSNVSATQF